MAPYMHESPQSSANAASPYATSDNVVGAAEPIAICGMALRLPGGIATPEQFWDFLIDKKDARTPIPPSRFNAESLYSKSGKPGRLKMQHGYFLDESVVLGALDTTFFKMPRVEVERLDPQQRLLLELARECFDSAGETDYRGKAIGTYIGSFGGDWQEIMTKDEEVVGQYKITGFGDFLLSNRIMYEYDLKGPSMTIRTGCSAALIGLHEACLAIRSGECDSALVGGANLILAPGLYLDMADQGVLSPNGSCRTFDAGADGYARAEAVNLVYIKKLSHAIRDGNPIRAVIRGTTVNADGKTASLSLPNSESHEALIRRAYEAAGLSDITKTAFVELHGTGTATGDPIETKTIGNVFGDVGVFIGGCKPNIGHSEAASGITSLIKSVLALEHGQIPPNIKFDKPNPKIPFAEKKLVVPLEPTPWPKDRLERVSVNSFGIGGANAHCVLDSAASFLGMPRSTTSITSAPQLMVFSANTPDSLKREVSNHRNYIARNGGSLQDTAYTLGCRRVHLPHRAFTIAGGDIEANVSPFTKATSTPTDLVLVFTGQGAQWPKMGEELLTSKPVFAHSMAHMDQILQALPDPPSWSLVDEMCKSAEVSRLHEAAISQCVCAAIQVALVDAITAVDLKVFAVVGHSSGETAAAYAAGKLTMEETIVAAYYRGQASSLLKQAGAMGAVGLGWQETAPYLRPGVVIACENSPSSVTISGDADQVENVLEAIHKDHPDVLARKLKVDKAYHSHHIKEAGASSYLGKFVRYVKSNTTVQKSKPVFFSTVTGNKLDPTVPTDAFYFGSNLESPVLFRTAIANLVQYHKAQTPNNLAFLEVGPHSALGGPLRQTLTQASTNAPYASCLIRGKNATQTFLSALGQLWQQGIAINFNKLINADGQARVVPDLPTYAWHHDHAIMFESRVTREWRQRKFPKHELLGKRVRESSETEPVYRNVLVLDHVPWVRDHNIKGDVIFPCAAYVGMAGEAARQLCSGDFAGFALRNVVIDSAMVLSESTSTEIITSLRRERLTDSLESSWWDFTITSHNGSIWMKHCSGQVRSSSIAPTTVKGDKPVFARNIQPSKWYNDLRNVGANYGPYFQGLSHLESSATKHTCHGTTLKTIQDDETFYSIHPTQFDFFLQLFSVASVKGVGHKLDKMTVPTFIEKLEMSICDTPLDVIVEAEKTPKGLIYGGGRAYNETGKLILIMEGTKFSPIEGEAVEGSDLHAGARTYWQPDVDFADMSALVHPHEDQSKYFPLTQQMHLVCVEEALRQLEGVETTLPHLQTFHAWLKRQPRPSHNLDMATIETKLSESAFAPCAVALGRVLDNIVAIFKGEVEPLEVLLPDNTLTDLYDSMNLGDRKPFFQALGHSNPGMRILEIGAGTGGTTNKILNWLKSAATGHFMYSHYTYTDVSGGFFGAAQERFKDFPRMSFQPLDISKSPADQGFELGSYDLVIGANVLHATPSLKETLSNVRKLLRPDGRLYMEELCCDIKSINFTMGSLPGWWLGAEDGRPDEPYVSPERWDASLREAGFAGVENVALDSPRPSQLLAYITARPAVERRKREVTLVHNGNSQDLLKQVRSQLIAKDYEPSVVDLEADMAASKGDFVCLVDVNEPFFEDITEQAYTAFQRLTTRASETSSGIFWLTRSSQVHCSDPRWSQVIGAARSIRNELSIDFATCEIDRVDEQALSTALDVFAKFHKRQNQEHLRPDYEYAIVDGAVHIPRLFPVHVNSLLEKQDENDRRDPLHLTVGRYGRLNTLTWSAKERRQLVGDEVAVEIKSVGMNFKDVLIAMGIVDSAISSLGLEAGGIIRDVGPDVKSLMTGDRVLVFGGGCFSTELIITANLCAKIPDSLSFDDAATMPCVFSTVIHGLLDVGQLEHGQTVLIHSACGGVGLAALQICKMVGADVYCTVGNEEKAKHLVSTFNIPRERIFNSRDPSFLADIMQATNGNGVDLVLNSLSGELLHASWACVAIFGKMIEIGKRDLIGNGKLALNVFELNRSYHGVDLGHLIDTRPRAGNRLLEKIVTLYSEGHIQPLRPKKMFTADDVETCFRYMQKGEHIGKIVVSLDTSNGKPLRAAHSAQSLRLGPDGCYLLVGGLGGLGRNVSNWMVEHGANHLVYLSRSAGSTVEDQAFFEELRSQGCAVTAIQGSVTDVAAVEDAIFTAPKPIRGVLNLSMVLRDEGFTKMTHEKWTTTILPKVRGTWNLHNACVSQSVKLDFFLLFSSLSGIMGQQGQANYASANTFLDSFVQYRQSLGLTAAVVDVGTMLDHGYVAENPAILERLQSQGNYGIRVPQLLDALAAAVHSSPTSLAKNGYVNTAQLSIGLRSLTPLDDPSNRVVWKRDRRMAYYHSQGAATGQTAISKANSSDELVAFVRSATGNPSVLSTPDAASVVAHQLALQLFRLLLKPLDNEEEIDVSGSLHDAGLDSLVAVEMRSWWKTVFGFDISVLEMLGAGTLLALGEKAVRGLKERLSEGKK